MKFAISSNIERVPFPPISAVRSWVAGRTFSARRPLVDFCQAIPDYPPAPELIDHLRQQVADPAVARYSPDEGLPEVREEICAWYRRRYGAGPAPSELCLTVGASQAFWLAMSVLCRAGDEVVVQLPAYFDHPMALQTLGVTCRWAPFDAAGGGQPDVEAIAALLTPRTRAILLVTPGNPTGTVIEPEILRQLLALTARKRIALVLDETYSAFIADDAPPHDLFAAPDWSDHFVHLASFGKTFALTGYRAGALAASEAFIHQALKAQDSMVVCQPRLSQLAVAYGCARLDDWVGQNNAMMQRRHQVFCREFDRHARPFVREASGGFFAWVKHPFAGSGGWQVARRLAEKADLLCLPGEAFGPGLERYLRLAFGNVEAEGIPRAVRRFAELIEDGGGRRSGAGHLAGGG